MGRLYFFGASIVVGVVEEVDQKVRGRQRCTEEMEARKCRRFIYPFAKVSTASSQTPPRTLPLLMLGHDTPRLNSTGSLGLIQAPVCNKAPDG